VAKASARVRESLLSLAARARLESQLRDAYRLINRTARREARDNQHMRVLLAACLGRDANCIDVGAHAGDVLREIVRCAPDGHHIAYEPLPHLATDLERVFPAADIRCAALSDHGGAAEFLYDGSQPARSTLHAHAFTDHRHVTAIRVRLERLDDALPGGYVPALIKIDVEGTEAEVLRGAIETLKRHRPIVVFEHGGGGTSSPGDVHALLVEKAGLRIYDIDGSGPYSLAEFEAMYSRPTLWNWIARP
jgi:FkbM family methyltransferase